MSLCREGKRKEGGKSYAVRIIWKQPPIIERKRQ